MDANFRDMLNALSAARVDFLVVGAHALAAHGRPRATGHLDIWVSAEADHAPRVYAALADFGVPLAGIVPGDFATAEVVYQIGLPPARIDVLTSLTGLDFAEAWPRRVEVALAGLRVPLLGRDDLIANKRATGRPQDLADVAALERMAG